MTCEVTDGPLYVRQQAITIKIYSEETLLRVIQVVTSIWF